MKLSEHCGGGDTVPESEFVEAFKQVSDEHRQRVYQDAADRYEGLRQKGYPPERIWMLLREEMVMAIEEAVTAMLAFGGPLAHAAGMVDAKEREEQGRAVVQAAEELESFLVGGYIAPEQLGEPSPQDRDAMDRWMAEMEEELSGSWKEVA